MTRGRQPGFISPHRKLTFAIAQEIRQRHAGGNGAFSMAKEYGVTHQVIYDILRNRSYFR